jgi:hypothetical protein
VVTASWANCYDRPFRSFSRLGATPKWAIFEPQAANF